MSKRVDEIMEKIETLTIEERSQFIKLILDELEKRVGKI